MKNGNTISGGKISVRLDAGLAERVREIAGDERRPLAGQLDLIVEEWLRARGKSRR